MKIAILNIFCILLLINNAAGAVRWASASNGEIPSGAILSGNDWGEKVYTCRAWYGLDLIPGKLTASNKGCNIAYDGREVKVANYDVAISNGAFVVFTYRGAFPTFTYPVEGGFYTSKKMVLFACRASIDGNLSVGKYEDNKCLIAYGGGQRTFDYPAFEYLKHENSP